MLLGSVGSAYISVLSSLLGIGGGIIHVPFLMHLGMLPHTWRDGDVPFCDLTFIALTANGDRTWALGELVGGLPQTMYLAVGVMMGAPLGASLSTLLRGSLIVRLLAVALCLVGLRLLAQMLP